VNQLTLQMHLRQEAKEENQAKKVNQVSLVRLALKDSLVKRETVEYQEEEEKTVLMAFLENLAFLAWMACLVSPETREILDYQEELVLLDPVEMMVNKDHKVDQDQEAKTVLKVNEVPSLDLLESQDYRVLMVLMDHQESLV